MVKKGSVKSLLTLLKGSQDAEAQRFAALALANCASAVFNRVAMVQEGVLEPLILFIRSEEADLIGRQYCAMCIGGSRGAGKRTGSSVPLSQATSLRSRKTKRKL
jgi:hypothetical protein